MLFIDDLFNFYANYLQSYLDKFVVIYCNTDIYIFFARVSDLCVHWQDYLFTYMYVYISCQFGLLSLLRNLGHA